MLTLANKLTHFQALPAVYEYAFPTMCNLPCTMNMNVNVKWQHFGVKGKRLKVTLWTLAVLPKCLQSLQSDWLHGSGPQRFLVKPLEVRGFISSVQAQSKTFSSFCQWWRQFNLLWMRMSKTRWTMWLSSNVFVPSVKFNGQQQWCIFFIIKYWTF